jgi:2-aminoethylphosphonate-pyruvate transaminase
VRAEWTEALPLEAVDDVLRADPSVTHVVAVHNETTTGRLNDVGGLLEVAGRHGVWVMLDAVSSFGAEAIDFAHPRLLAVASTGNKCLHGIVGIAFVLLRREVPGPGQSEALYLDLFAYREAQASGYSPFTQAVHACFALQEALAELADQGGWAARRERYRSLSTRVRSELAALGVDTFLDPGAYSSMISSFVLPRGWNYQRLHDALRAAGFVIYAGQGGLYHAMFRICTMGDLWDEDLERLLRTLRSLLA